LEKSKTVGGLRLFRLAFFLVGMNVLWRSVRYALGFPLFGDEAFVANSILLMDFQQLTEGLEHYQIVPLFYLWGTLLVSKIAGSSEWALRLLSYGAGVAAVLLFLKLAFEMLPRKPALISLAVFCASYYPVRHAAEVKPYSFDLLVSLCITLAVLNFIKSPSPRALTWWAVACSLGVWASYPSIFAAGGSCLVLGAYGLAKHPGFLRPVSLVGLLTLVSFGLMFASTGSAQRAAGEEVLINLDLWSSTFPPWSEPSRFGDWFVHTHLGKMFAYPNGGNNGGSTLTFVLFCVGAWAMWRDNRLNVLILLSPFLLMFAAASIEAYPYGGSARVAQHVAPAICLLAGTGLARLMRLTPGPPLEKRVLVVVGFCVVLILGGMARDVIKPYKELADQVNRQVVADLAAMAAPDEQWIVFGSFGKNKQGVPDLYDWAGSAARLRYYLLRDAGRRLRWGPGDSEMEQIAGSPARLLVYRHPYVQFPATEYAEFLQRVERNFILAGSTEYPFKEGAESLIVYDLETRP
jgi:hypothetical protein